MDYRNVHVPGARIEVVPLNLPEFENDLIGHKLDFLITNPQHYIAVGAKYGVITNRFGGVIFLRADRTTRIVTRIITAVVRHFGYCEEAKVSASIGISIFNDDAADADEAMYSEYTIGSPAFW